MASLSHDSELMTQHVAAVAVPNSSRFVTVKDEIGNPMVFALGTDLKLHLIKTNKDGNRVLIDFGSLLRLVDTYKAYAFDVAQSVDSTLYVIIATQDQSTGSDLIVLSPFKPADYDLSEPSIDLRLLMMHQTGVKTKTAVKAIYLSNSTSGQNYPLALFAFQPLDRINTTQDIARLTVDSSFTGWKIEFDLSLPENAFKILALQPLNLPMRRGSMPGFIALYEIQGEFQLVFTATLKIEDTYYSVSLECPPGANSLSAFINGNGFTDLVVGGEGLYHFEAAQCKEKGAKGRKVSGSGVFASARQLYVTQSNTQLSVWATNTSDGIGYLTSDTALKNPNPPVQVIPDSQGGTFSPFKPTSGAPEQFIISSNTGVLTLLHQDSVSGIWKTVPFFTSALETTVDIPSYTTQITIKGSDMMPLIDSVVLLKSSGLVSIIANGRSVLTGPIGVPVKTDQQGLITLIIPTNDISSYTFTVTGSPGGELEGRSFVVDPTEKVNSILDTIHNGSDLTNITLSSGKKLLEGTKLSPGEIEQVARAIEQLQNSRKDVIGDTARGIRHSMTVKDHPPATHGGRSLIDMAWDAWHWLESITTKFVTWSIEKFQQGAAFVVQLGETFYRWVLDGVTEIGKALSWIFDKVLELGEKVVEWLGFIFNWGDIQATQRSIVHLTNSALSSGLSFMDNVESKVDVFFDGIVKQLQESSGQIRPQDIDKATANGESGGSLAVDSSSAKANWSQYQFIHGGGIDASRIYGEEDESEPLEKLWTKVVLPLYDTFKKLVEDLAETICRLFFFKNDKSLSVQEAMANMKSTVLVEFINGIRKVAVGLVKVAKSLINDFKKFINYKISIPVFSSLYKQFISGGTDLTFLDGLALILAIPITILTKVVTGKAPPDMTQVQYGDIINGTATDKQQLLNFNHFSSVSSLFSNGLDGLISTVSMVTGGVMVTKAASARSTNVISMAKKADMVRMTSPKAISVKGIAKSSWKDVLGVISRLTSIPSNPSMPAYELRWISWILSCINTGIAIALRRVTAAASVAIERVLAVIEGSLASINYAIIVAINTIEFQTASFPGKNNSYTLLKTMSGTFDLLGTLSGDLGHIAVDPETKGWAGVCSLAAQALSYSIEGSVVMVKVASGEYNYILGKVM